ncbi:MAG TPA: methyltransferase [Flavisolibacter sp.]|jgi:tRNA1Val (adenine37-N6)-methyltransferase|nr:methyltransferase [Flavisolibacter sp.]
MPNPFFRFKQFTVYHDRCAMKVTTDACLFGAWTAEIIGKKQPAISNERFLDVGAGTGLLSLMVAQQIKCQIDAVEIEAGAAEQAKENIAASPWKGSIHVINEDVLQWKPNMKYGIIFSNPPFYENEIRSEKREKNMAHHDSGLKLEALLCFIKENLEADGIFFLLLPAKRKTELALLLEKHDLFPERIVQVQQTVKHQPFRLMLQGCLKNSEETNEGLLAIKDSGDAYTPSFIRLLHPYYLYL